VLFDDDHGDFHDLMTGEIQTEFLALMEALAMRWGDQFRGEIVRRSKRMKAGLEPPSRPIHNVRANSRRPFRILRLWEIRCSPVSSVLVLGRPG